MSSDLGKFLLELRLGKFFDGTLLPVSRSKEHDSVEFYCIVVRQAGEDIVRVPFKFEGNKTIQLHLYLVNTVIPNSHVASMNHVRLVHTSYPMEIHLYKFVRPSKDVLGMQRIISDDSSIQDTAIFVKKNIQDHSLVNNKYYTLRWVPQSAQDILHPINCIDIYENDPTNSPSWNTQRNFYRKMHESMNMELHRLNCEKTINFLRKEQTFSSMLDFITKWSVFVNPCEYVPDTKWFDKGVNDDRGDAAIESTKMGDCEDFAHYYSRMFYLLIQLFTLINDTNQHTKTFCKLLVHYRPFVYICKIKLDSSRYDYHSTMLMLPREKIAHTPVISFEVTNNYKHVVMDNKLGEFYKWHVEHYFVVDRYHMARLDVKNEKIENLVLNNITNRFFPY